MVERCIYIFCYIREQLHVSALDNGHLQVVYELTADYVFKQ